MASVRVLLADDNVRLLAELRKQVGKLFEVVGAVEDGKQAVDAVLRLDPDVLVLDISMPVMNGLEAAEYLRQLKCRTKTVILTALDDEDYVHAAFSAGASAYVTKQRFTPDLVSAIRAVMQGNIFISPSIRARL